MLYAGSFNKAKLYVTIVKAYQKDAVDYIGLGQAQS